MDELSIFPTSEILSRWYMEYLDTPGTALTYETWYLMHGKDKLLEYFVNKHDGEIHEVMKRVSEGMETINKIRG